MENVDELRAVTIDPGKLPVWTIAKAINLAYTEAIVRLSNALSLDEFSSIQNFSYRIYINDPHTNKKYAVIQKGYNVDQEGFHAASIPFGVAVSILAIIRLKDYLASYSEPRHISIFLSGAGEEGRMSDLERMLVLFEERPEFWMYTVKEDDSDAETQAQDTEEETYLPTTAT